jgi:hypothetical protein
MQKSFRPVALVVAALLFASCSAGREVVKPVTECWTGGPTWTCMNTARCSLPEYPDSLCSVGRSDQIEAESLAIATGELRAKGQLGAFMAEKVDRYIRSGQTSLGKRKDETSTQFTNRIDQAVSDAAQSGVRTPNTYFSKDTSTYYVLAEIDAKALRENGKGIHGAKELNETEKQEVLRLYDAAVDEWQRAKEQARAR